ncbi:MULTISPECIES: chromate transporter [Oceanobacillus]|uniref:Transporter YwrA n=1 Tax=Oceanobacillus kimchii TaxID=746691 RepID=A0ABQ5TK81_9BACI|nr:MULTISPECIES: chromate transporter [Oceanobacillus]MBT2600223.1 chromate transporter [Oceanobacillus sp. ISL-74]MBT2650381.1 chromate transporter [Oceanobacillus sp. ISL-73]OEH55067.1 chromate transporter [Oceanobacillus sp. E9]GLO67269.1 putative transporter YwrA [Oceanobacillus kimchii]
MKKHWHIFIAFFRVGMLGFGGGPASIPLIQKEVVQKYHWMDDEEFSDILAIANTLPGPVATKLAGYIGYRVSGWIGMLNSLIASVIPTVILLIILLRTLSGISEFDWVKGMTAAVIAVVGMMMAVLTWQFIQKAGKGLGWIITIIMIIIMFILLQVIHIHPGIVIAVLLILALALPVKKQGKEGDPS